MLKLPADWIQRQDWLDTKDTTDRKPLSSAAAMLGAHDSKIGYISPHIAAYRVSLWCHYDVHKELEMPNRNTVSSVHSTHSTQSVDKALMPPDMRADLAIAAKYEQTGGASGLLGKPSSDVVDLGQYGFCRHFSAGSIYWTSTTGAHEVHGDIRGKWSALGSERSFLGYPASDETSAPDGVGRYNHFQGGSIYWTPQTGAHEVHGDIRGKWSALGWERGFLGYPVSDETGTPDGVGRYSDFQGGSIYWTPATGAHEVHGDLPDRLSFDSGPITFPAGVAAGGSSQIIMTKDGKVELKGNMHDSGALPYRYSVVCVLTDVDNRPYTFAHSGTIAGTFNSGSRDDPWDGTEQHDAVAQNWRSLVAGGQRIWQSQVNVDARKIRDAILLKLAETALGPIGGTVLAMVV